MKRGAAALGRGSGDHVLAQNSKVNRVRSFSLLPLPSNRFVTRVDADLREVVIFVPLTRPTAVAYLPSPSPRSYRRYINPSVASNIYSGGFSFSCI